MTLQRVYQAFVRLLFHPPLTFACFLINSFYEVIISSDGTH
jgi:hypothetical protein